ncbi:hypothetical protein Tco_0432619 [Tanacetum coccineum]
MPDTQAESDVAVDKRRHGNHAVMQVVLIPKAKPDTVSEIPLLDHPLILTPEFGHGVTLGARLTRVASHLAVWPKYLKVTGAGICFNKLAPSVGPNFCTTKSLEWQLHNESPTCSVKPIRLSFDDEERPEEKLEEPKDLRNPYKEVLKSPFSRRIIRFSALNHHLHEAFVERFALRRKCCKDPMEVSKIIRKANETLPDFKERWTKEMSYIPDVPIVMQISSFMSNSKCLELARCFSDQVPKTVIEMMKRVDDFVKSEEVFKNT